MVGDDVCVKSVVWVVWVVLVEVIESQPVLCCRSSVSRDVADVVVAVPDDVVGGVEE